MMISHQCWWKYLFVKFGLLTNTWDSNISLLVYSPPSASSTSSLFQLPVEMENFRSSPNSRCLGSHREACIMISNIERMDTVIVGQKQSRENVVDHKHFQITISTVSTNKILPQLTLDKTLCNSSLVHCRRQCA